MCLPANLLSSEQAGNRGSERDCLGFSSYPVFFFVVQTTFLPYHVSAVLFAIQPFFLLFVRHCSLPHYYFSFFLLLSLFLGFRSCCFTMYSSWFFDSLMGRCEVWEPAHTKSLSMHPCMHTHTQLHYKAQKSWHNMAMQKHLLLPQQHIRACWCSHGNKLQHLRHRVVLPAQPAILLVSRVLSSSPLALRSCRDVLLTSMCFIDHFLWRSRFFLLFSPSHMYDSWESKGFIP